MTTAPYLALRPTGPGGPPAPVGREELLARLERALHTRGRALLTGPAGVGKTELALAEASRAEARGETVLWLATLPSDREIPGASAAALVASVAATVHRPETGGGRRREPRPADKAPAGPEASAVFDELPGPQRTAVAMLCREAPLDAGGWDPIALR
ncbi:helix-turn-helix transcriptional regulator, partial [Streptomyces massasporeus]